MRDVLLISEPMLLLAAGAIFVILFVSISAALKEGSLFGRTATMIVTICVSLLCIIGLFHLSGLGNETTDTAQKNGTLGSNSDIILIPYEALAIAILVILFLLFLLKIFGVDKLPSNSRGTKHRMRESKPFEKKREQLQNGNDSQGLPELNTLQELIDRLDPPISSGFGEELYTPGNASKNLRFFPEDRGSGDTESAKRVPSKAKEVSETSLKLK